VFTEVKAPTVYPTIGPDCAELPACAAGSISTQPCQTIIGWRIAARLKGSIAASHYHMLL